MIEKKNNEKLIVTVTLADSLLYLDAHNYPKTPEEIAETAYRCYEEGAAIAHIHLPKGKCKKTVDLIRDKCDMVIQAGMSSDPIEERKELFESGSDMISVMLSHHDEYFPVSRENRLHLKEELEDYCRLCRKTKIKPEFETWHLGSVWSLNYLIERNLVDKPYFLTLFFNWPGGNWSPATPDEFFHRIKYLPVDSVISVSVMQTQQKIILPLAIVIGKHVRVGIEDYPYIKEGVLAKDNVELVKNIIRLSKEIGREVADPSEAKKIIGLP